MFLLGGKTDLKFGVNVPSTQHNHQCLFYLYGVMSKVFPNQDGVYINDFFHLCAGMLLPWVLPHQLPREQRMTHSLTSTKVRGRRCTDSLGKGDHFVCEVEEATVVHSTASATSCSIGFHVCCCRYVVPHSPYK